ncbi:HEAT repeat domain-containing protein [Rhodospirillum rubrum]|uniref:HEAT repeat domain-containing protein n=1 Tax=Rhodospirillum rubrum TaxID=1085 RepID=UPI001906C1DE|nr:HEAT repeat domain-containing protein [Rhodospirillum rubrum]
MGLVRAETARDGSSGPADDRHLTDLLSDLAAPAPGARRAAARDLADHPEAALALCERLEVETAPSVRAMIFTALIKLQTPVVASRIARFLRSDDAQLRNAAIEALQEMPDAIAPHLQELLTDDDSDIRIFAVTILGALRLTCAPDWLVEVIRRESHINVCSAAVDALAEIGGPEAIEDLEALLDRFPGDSFMKFAIETTIRRIRGQ